MSKSKKLVIFDLDNTLVITKPAAKIGYKQAINFIAKNYGIFKNRYKLYNHWKKIVLQNIGEKKPQKRSFQYSLNLLLKEHKIPSTKLQQALKIYEKELLKNIKPQQGAKDLLNWLNQISITVTVTTGSSQNEAKQKLKKVGLLPYIHLLITPNQTNTMKPAKNFYQIALKESQISPRNTLVIGDDSVEDINPAKALKLKTILIPSSKYHLNKLKPKIISLLELAEDIS